MSSGDRWLSREEVNAYQGSATVNDSDTFHRRSRPGGDMRSLYNENNLGSDGGHEKGFLSHVRSYFGPNQPVGVAHSPPPRFRCDECMESFFVLDDLDVHKLTVHHKEETAFPPPYGAFLYSKAPSLTDLHIARPQTESRLGKFRGIQGENNSCYLDSILMAMFYANDTYDGLLAAPKEPSRCVVTMDQDIEYARLYLTMHIVNNLRRRGYVPSQLVLEWRRMISLWFGSGVDLDSYCAEEEACEFAGFLLKIFGEGSKSTRFVLERVQAESKQYFKTQQKTSVSPKRQSIMPEAQAMMQLLPPREECSQNQKIVWNIETLLDYTIRSENLYFAELNSSLILQLPRYGKRDRVIGAVVPNPELYLCYGGRETTKARFRLCALVVIGTSHFVTYLRVANRSTQHCKPCASDTTVGCEVGTPAVSKDESSQPSYAWLYYDSMSDRDEHQNIPIIQDVTDELSILESPNAKVLVAQKMSQLLSSPHLRRVVEDLSLAFYTRVNDDVSITT